MWFVFHLWSRVKASFYISREPKEDAVGNVYNVVFSLRDECIVISNAWEDFSEIEVVVELNNSGECCFKIIGEDKEYVRWQIARRALGSLFFDGPRSPTG